MTATGYAHPRYAESLAEFGAVRALPGSGGWLLERSIPESAARDGMGPYPLLAVPRWPALRDDLASIT